MRTNEDVAWAAGFFDGEGSFAATCPTYLCKDGTRIDRRYLRLSVAQKDPALLERFRVIFDAGTVHAYTRHGVAAGNNLQINGKAAFPVVVALWPYIGEQKKADFKRVARLIHDSRRQAAALEQQTRLARTCEGCGNPFTTTNRHPNKRFCSQRCYQRTWKRERRMT